MRSPNWRQLLSLPLLITWGVVVGITAFLGLAAIVVSSRFGVFSVDFPGLKQALEDTGIGFDSAFQFAAWIVAAIPAAAIFKILVDAAFGPQEPTRVQEVKKQTPQTQLRSEPKQTVAKTAASQKSVQRPPDPVRTPVSIQELSAQYRRRMLTNISGEVESRVKEDPRYGVLIARAKNSAASLDSKMAGKQGWFVLFDDTHPYRNYGLILYTAQTLIAGASRSNTAPFPVILSLRQWKPTENALETWLVAKLHSLYNVPTDVLTHWVETDAVAILATALPGGESFYHAIIGINKFREHYSLPFAVAGFDGQRYFRDGLALTAYASPEALRAGHNVRVLSAQYYLLSNEKQMLAEERRVLEGSHVTLMLDGVFEFEYHYRSDTFVSVKQKA